MTEIRTGIIYDEKYLEHEQNPFHPERKERLSYTIDQLMEEGIFENENIKLIKPSPAKEEDILRVHTKEYVEFLKRESKRGGFIDFDTIIPVGLYDIAVLSAGGAITSARVVDEGEVKNAFGLIRPPGHHAKPYIGAGFCYLNNMAIMVEWLKSRGYERILIIDWDAHHGDGTQEIFYEDNSVLFISTHQMPLYPGTGYIYEVGKGEGEGFTVNIPLPPGTSDEGYIYILEEVIKPLALEFKPEFIAISAGQDNHFTDPLTSLALTAKGYATIMKEVVTLAEKLCDGKIVAILEGGYSVEALPYTNLAIISAMAGLDISQIREPETYLNKLKWRKRDSVMEKLKMNVKEVIQTHSQYWDCF